MLTPRGPPGAGRPWRRCRRSRRRRRAAAGGVEQRGGDGGAVAAGAVHPDLAGRHLVEPAGELVDRDVHRAVDPGAGVLVAAADVEDDHLAVAADPLEVGEGRRSGSVARLAVGPVARPAGRVRRGPVDADPDQLALGLGDLVGGLAEQGQRGAPGDQPAEVGGEPAVEAEVQGAGGVAGGEGGPVAQVDDPLAGLDAAAQLGGVGALGRCSGRARPGRRCSPAPCARSRPARRRARRAARGRRSPRPG